MGVHRTAPAAKRRLRLIELLESRALLSANGLVAPEIDVIGVDGHYIGDGHDHSHEDIRYNAAGLAYYVDRAHPEAGGGHGCGCSCAACSAAAETSEVEPAGEPVATLDEVPVYNSNPDAPNVFYLDFNSHVVSETAWNSDNKNQPIHAVAYDTDGDNQSFSQSELDDIFEIWSRVSEDFMPFNINVTTVEPPAEAFVPGRGAIRAVISTNVDDAAMGGSGETWFANAGGVAFVRSWRWAGDVPVWVFYNQIPRTAKAVAEAASHEFGHSVGLSHDGGSGEAYYPGHGSGETGWAPIMGAGYNREVTQWSKGEYDGATNREDDLAIITAPVNLITYQEDDHGLEVDATPVVLEDNAFSVSGVIERNTDTDEFRIEHPGGPVSIVATTDNNGFGANLDAELILFDEAGVELDGVARSAPMESLSAHILLEDLAPGTYYLHVAGDRYLPESGPGYSRYGSIGGYSIEGQLGQPVVVANAGDAMTILEGESLQLDASASVPAMQLAYEWDIDGDGTYGDAVGEMVEVPWARLEELGIADNGSYEVTLRVTNPAGDVSEDAMGLTVTNVEPRVSLTAPPLLRPGQQFQFSGTAVDIAADTLTYEWNFQDGDESQPTDAATVDHIFADPGTYPVSLTVRDDDGGETTEIVPVTVTEELIRVVSSSIHDGDVVSNAVEAVEIGFSDAVLLSASSLVVRDAVSGAEFLGSDDPVSVNDSNVATFSLAGIQTGKYEIALVDVFDEFGIAFDGDGDGNAGGPWSIGFVVSYAGDANLDMTVDFSDFLFLSQNFGSSSPGNRADFDDDGVVGFGDFLELARNFGLTEASLMAVR